jgi:hypothetical protein
MRANGRLSYIGERLLRPVGGAHPLAAGPVRPARVSRRSPWVANAGRRRGWGATSVRAIWRRAAARHRRAVLPCGHASASPQRCVAGRPHRASRLPRAPHARCTDDHPRGAHTRRADPSALARTSAAEAWGRRRPAASGPPPPPHRPCADHGVEGGPQLMVPMLIRASPYWIVVGRSGA